jgi:chitobiase/beta-hexosaminidase-like protein/dockerin type I repeat protein
MFKRRYLIIFLILISYLILGKSVVLARVATPVIFPQSGTFDYLKFINIETQTPGATIYYTLNGNVPTSNSIEYFGAFALTQSAMIRAIVVIENDTDSYERTVNITINPRPASYQIGDYTYIEAEGAQDIAGFLERPSSKASNEVYLLALDDDPLEISFTVTANSTGNYRIWARYTENSYAKIYVSVDGVDAGELHSAKSGWNWLSIQGEYAWTAGSSHTIKIKPLRIYKGGKPKIDRLLITTDSSYIPPNITVLHPDSGERWLPGNPQEIRWQSTGSLDNVRVEFSQDNGNTWSPIVSSTANSGSYLWNAVPGSEISNGKVRISDSQDNSIFDISDGNFKITNNINPYDVNETFYFKRLQSIRAGWNFDSDEERIAYYEEKGAEQAEVSMPATFDAGSELDHYPFYEGIDVYKSVNTVGTTLVGYTNLGSIHNPINGEAILGNVENPGWFLNDTGGDRVHNPMNGRHCFNFQNRDMQRYMADRIVLFYNAGISGVYFDSFQTSGKRVFENGFWYKDYIDGAYANPIDVVNPQTGQIYQAKDWMRDYRYATNAIRRMVDQEVGNNEVNLWINGLKHGNLEEYSDIIDGFLDEGFCGPSMTKVTQHSWWFGENGIWEQDVNELIESDAKDKYSLLYVSSVTGDPLYQTSEDAALFTLSSMLMGIKGPDTKAYLRNYFAWLGFDNLQIARFVPYGRYEKEGEIYKREFQGALVYVNPTASSHQAVILARPMYYMRTNGEWSSTRVNTLTLDPGRGTIFVDSVIFEGGTQYIEGDVNGDGVVDKQDMDLVIEAYGNPLGFNPATDVDGNGKVNAFDIAYVVYNLE